MYFINRLNQYWEKTILSGPYWLLKAVAVIVLVSIFFSLGQDLRRVAYLKNLFDLIAGHPNPQLCCYYWSDIAYQVTDMLMQKLTGWDTVHQANMRFRPVLPILWATFKSIPVVYGLQVALGIAQIYMVCQIVYELVEDRVQAFYFTLGFGGIYTGVAFFLDFYGFGDALAYAFMTAALYFHRPLLIFLALFLACWVDERALVNAAFIVLYHWLAPYKNKEKPLVFHFRQITPQAIAVLVGGAAYLAIRIYLTSRYQLKTPFGGPSLFFHVKEGIKTFGIRFWSGFESFWLLVFAMLGLLYYRRNYLLLSLVGAFVMLTTFTILMQGDFTRTQAYGFPIFFIAIAVLKQELEPSELRVSLLTVALIASVFSPLIY
ncbi:hypothetical protein [Tellurirhabdus bombi]|uniref:hypothetical protein n=1 Tax=Tellurirhabdus bombi TaxID=2907205 RepID=UPI001F1E2D02|nr:hypothetical protein [Tellurirhabdus bombi]